MAITLTLDDTLAFSDLRVFLERAARVDDTATRLVANNGVLAVYVGVLFPVGLLDSTPTVLGLRTWRIAEGESCDAVVPVRSILDRLAHIAVPDPTESEASKPVRVPIPPMTTAVSWAGITPPRGGWERVGSITSSELGAAAQAGIAEVAEVVPSGTGEQLIRKVRSEVWGRPLAEGSSLPAGAGFAATALGFISDAPVRSVSAAVRAARDAEEVPVFKSETWQRVSLRRGHLLVRVR
ncbi:hypothetical protein [Lysinibacter sp. HNR]|uniref:hypothetical protein n=1 Tax=Lysinibacter sp. HNR TaxID=3031408 RepID=UPI002435CAC9|nr:hypothetical protein [Lysinibacter sp. HNR]WGD36436.1 hypothetical protein FrondiHNR_08080 [Lysinibacter sp. HNR]